MIDLPVFDRSKESLNINVISGPAFSIHRYLNGFQAFYITNIFIRAKLAALIRVYDLRFTIFVYCHSQSINNPFSLHSVRQTPAQDTFAVYVHYGQQIHVSSDHGNIGDIKRPNLVGSLYFQIRKQIGVFIPGRINDGGAQTALNRL